MSRIILRWVFCFFLLCTVALSPQTAESCTVGTVSGQITLDGRPLLWKNRDTSFRDNEIAFFKGKVYDFVGIINKNDTTQVWMGLNTAGFAIMNSESLDQDGDSVDTEGYFMKKALAGCGSLYDFEKLLSRTNTRRGTKANFGCIDAYGEAAIYETGNRTFKKIDSRNSVVIPYGFVVRANFSMTGKHNQAYGAWRFHRAFDLFEQAVVDHKMTHSYILQSVARDIHAWEVNPYPLPFTGQLKGAEPGYINTHNCINRHRTVSCAVFKGVKPGENPALATMWCILGEPIAGVAIPVWPRAGEVPEELNGKNGSDLNVYIQEIESLLYHDADHPHLIDTARLKGGRYDLLTEFTAFEREIIEKTENKLKAWRRRPPSADVMRNFQHSILRDVLRFLKR